MHKLAQQYPPGAIQEVETLLEKFKGQQVYLVGVRRSTKEPFLRIATVSEVRVRSHRLSSGPLVDYITMLSEGKLIDVHLQFFNLEGLRFKNPCFIFGEYACAEEHFNELSEQPAVNK